MTKRNRPAVDHFIAPLDRVSRGGQPMTYSRAPAPDLAPWIGRFYAARIDAPADYRLDCRIFNDAAMIHVQIAGLWTADSDGKTLTTQCQTLFTGPHTRFMPVSVTGSFISVGFLLRAGAMTILTGLHMPDWRDRAVPVDEFGSPPAWSSDDFDIDGQPEDWIRVLENAFRAWLSRKSDSLPNEIVARFETAAFVDPSISVAEFAAGCGVGERTVERIVRRDFGFSPKQVLRRARALDMASHLRGVADAAEAEELSLRYYDQSHLIHEFAKLFGLSPKQFIAAPLPMLTMGLELRQARRLEVIERLAPGAIRPWE